jgi:hypothetical protein
MIGFFKEQNKSKIPGDNGSSLNKLITLKIIALTNITLIIETSVLGKVPLNVCSNIEIYHWDGQTALSTHRLF